MKKAILSSLVAVAIALLIFSLLPVKVASENDTVHITETVHAQEVIQVEPSLKEKMLAGNIAERSKIVEQLVQEKAKQYGVSAEQMLTTIRCENKSLDPNKQSGHRYDFNSPKRNIVAGQQERSFGLVMIHLPDHPTVSLAQATDPEFAITFMAKKFAEGDKRAWTCWRMHYE